MHQGQGKCSTFPPGAFNCICYKVLGVKQQQQQLKARVISIGTDKRSLNRNSAAFKAGWFIKVHSSWRVPPSSAPSYSPVLIKHFFSRVKSESLDFGGIFWFRFSSLCRLRWEKMKPVIGFAAISLNWWKCISRAFAVWFWHGGFREVQPRAVILLRLFPSRVHLG